jgi:DnaJ-class molecular chaperone
VTPDEARERLGVTAAASVDEIRDAFRRTARTVHPDLHPDATSADRSRLGREFDRAREARDILVRHTLDPLRKPAPTSTTGAPQANAQGGGAPRSTPPPAPPAGPAPRVTMRFDEFVAWTDAAGFGSGARSPRYVDWARIIVWSTLGVLILGVVGGWILAATTI